MKKFFVTLTLILVCVSVFSVSVAAVYTSGDLNTNRYYSPLRFDFEILGTTAQLTPTISYASGSPLTYDTFEQATQVTSPSNIITSINRKNFQVSTLGQTCVDVSYRLSFDVSQSVDDFTMRITAAGGIYDFLKYGIPELAIPTGYTVSAEVSYNVRFTQDQTNTSVLTDYVQYNATYYGNDEMPLILDTYKVNGVDYDILGGVLVNDYVAELTFVSDDSGNKKGDAGYYMWNTVLTYPPELVLENVAIDADFWLWVDPASVVTVAGIRSDGSAYEEQIDGIFIIDASETDFEFNLGYEIWNNGTVVTVYNSYYEEWYLIDYDLTEEGAVLTPTTVRLLKFDDDLSECFDIQTLAQLQFLQWIFDNTSYYTSNPLQTVTASTGTGYAFTDGDGGMYLHYYADRMLDSEISSTYADFYGYGYTHGLANGSGDFSGDYGSWLGTAVGGFMDLELFPNFKIGGIMSTIVSVCLLMVFLKFFAGG